MGEDSSELIKRRVIRALQDVSEIRIDRIPTYSGKADPDGRRSPLRQQCFSMPGVALRRGEYYQVDLADDQVFKAKADHTYITSIKFLESLNKIHDNAKKDGIEFDPPLGTEEVVAEVHFPPTRKLKKVNNEVVKVYEVRRSDPPKLIARDRYTVNAKDPIDTTQGKLTDMFRLTLPHPSQDAGIDIQWEWYIVD